jgi:hypothetical protein
VRKFFVTALLAAVAAVALSVAPTAGATSSCVVTCVPTSYVKFEHYADIFGYVSGWNGAMVIAHVRCTGGVGSLVVTLTQTATQSSQGFDASGSATVPVTCDNTDRRIPVAVVADLPPGYGFGCADVTGILTLPSLAVVAGSDTIEIVD